MTLDKSLLTDIILVVGIAAAFIISYVKRRNLKYSLLFSVFYICCYSLFVNYFLPFPMNLTPTLEFDQYLTIWDLFIIPDFSNISGLISDYSVMIIIAFILGALSPFLFRKCRTFRSSIKMLLIPFGMNIFFFIMNSIMGGLYQYVDIMNIIVFAFGFYISFIPVIKLFAKSFKNIDISYKSKKQANYDSII